MKIYKSLAELPSQHSPAAIALGTFDGLHIGHRQLVEKVITSAKQSGGVSVLFTFSNHPRAVLFPDHSPKLLMTQERKAELLAAMGLDMLVTIPFTEEFFKIMPQKFVELLVEYFRPYLVVIGDNYSYGYKGRGNSETMRQAGKSQGFAVEVLAMVMKEGTTVSSTLIRSLLTEGKVREAAKLLDRPYELQGLVVTGDQRGRLLGFPTANVAVDPSILLPADGVYAVAMEVSEKIYQGVANIGSNPTFHGEERRLEVFLLDFSGNLYGQEVRVFMYEHLRQERTFSDVHALISQMQLDIQQARNFFSKA